MSEEFKDCTLEINKQHRWIKVHHSGRTVLWVKNVALKWFNKSMIEILSDNRMLDMREELLYHKRRKRGQE